MNIEHFLVDSDEAPAALVAQEYLVPVEGKDGVLFPPTFAAAENSKVFPGGYNIDDLGGGNNVCLVDSVGSQANRIEPIFALPTYAALIPQIVIAAGDKQINLLEAGHRAGDALVRCTELQNDLQAAFVALKAGNATALTKIAPTSLLFGVWDSRDTQAKSPRLLSSCIRAFNVSRLTRSAQYNPATDYVEEGLLEETEDKDALKSYSERGFRHVPASASHGGIIANGGIRRDVTLQLAALRLLRAEDEPSTNRLRAYLLGLALVAFTKPVNGYLRQGCTLVLDGEKPPTRKAVYPDGRREDVAITHADALEFASQAAKKFGVGASKTVPFDTGRAKLDTSGDDKKGKAKKPKKEKAK